MNYSETIPSSVIITVTGIMFTGQMGFRDAIRRPSTSTDKESYSGTCTSRCWHAMMLKENLGD